MATGADELASYSSWANRSAADVLTDVKSVGGWAKVFPKDVPEFAHKLRNYFNENPSRMTQLFKTEKTQALGKLASKMAVDDNGVFKDGAGRVWFLMRTMGTAYHVGDGKPGLATIIGSAIAPRALMPFKLVAPDGTGGSSEVVILNEDSEWYLGDRQVSFNVRQRVDLSANTAGSYNYSETMVAGFDAHKLRDMTPHEKFGGAYAKVKIFAPLQARVFPSEMPK